MGRPARGRTLAAATTVWLATLLALWMAASAHAGTYAINDRPSAPTSANDSGPWTVFSSPQADKGSCSGGPGDWIGPLSGSMSPNSLDGVSVTVPSGSGITIHEAKIWWWVPKSSSGADVFPLASANGAVVNQANTQNGPYDRSINPDDWTLPSTTTSFVLANYCSSDDGPNGCNFGSGENPNLKLFGAHLTLADNNLPSGTVTGGALAGNGPITGTQSLAFTAADTDTGVRSVQLLVDGQVLAQKDYLAQCPYTNFVACPSSRSDTISWNTAGVSDGPHELALQITDAATNTVIVDDHTITVGSASNASNGTSGANGSGGTTGANGTNGTNGSNGETALTVNVTAPASSQGSVLLGSGVKWGVSLKVAPRRVRRGTKIRLTGAVVTSPRPGSGKLIYLQARSVGSAWRGKGRKRHRITAYGKWVTFQAFRARSNGTFSSVYKFKLGGHHTYQFQAVAPAEGQYRNPTGDSSTITVKEI